MLTKLLRAFRRRPITRSTSPRIRLAVEALEDRVVPSSSPLHVSGNLLQDPAGNTVVLRGVNIISLEWRADGGDNIMGAVNMALNDWHANLLRLPVNEDFWFGHNEASALSGAWVANDDGSAYRSLVDQVIATAKANNAYVMLDLHWSDMGVWGSQNGQHSMPDDHSTLFWQDAAARYANNSAVMFDPYNEPHFDGQNPDDAEFAIWKDGGMITENPNDFGFVGTYHSPGMQGLVNTIRATGANNIVAPEGLNWGADLSGVVNGHAISDPTGNLMYEAHLYYGNLQLPWVADAVENVGKSHPIYVGEWGSGGTTWQPSDQAAQENQAMIDYFNNHPAYNWTAWALTPDLNGDSNLYNLVNTWDPNDVTTDYGAYVKAALAAAPAQPPQGQPVGNHVGFSAARNSGVGAAGPQLLTSGNFNSQTDSIPDLAVTNSDGSISIMLGNGDGTYKPATTLVVDGVINPEGIVSGDFNHDGFDDLAIASNGAFAAQGAGQVKVGAVTILLGQGDGIFTRASALDLRVKVNGQALPNTVLPTYLATADMDGDGNLDLVVADFNNPHVYVYLGNGDGSFRFNDTNYDPDGVSNAEQPVIADFNGDGILDIAVANKGNGTVSLFQGLGNGYITSAGNINLPGVTGAIGLAAGDLDGDGKADLAVANYGTDDVGAHTLNLIRNTSDNGVISFAVPTAISLGNHLLNVVMADFNEDGKLDLAVSSAGNTVDPNAVKDSSVWVLYNQGGFNFPKPQLPLFAGLNPVGLIAADFNDDGHIDLASANQDSNNVSVFLNQFAVPAVTKAALSVPANVDFGAPLVMAIFAITPPPGAAIPTGTVTFTVDGVQTNAVSLNGVNWSLDQWVQTQPGTWIYRGDDGVYEVRVTLLHMTVGSHTVNASYSGDAKHNAASDSAQVTVAKADVAVELAAPAAAAQSAKVTLTATLTSPVSGISGKVSFMDNGKLIGTATVVNGKATLVTTALGVGFRGVTAQYQGSANFNASPASDAHTVRVTGKLTTQIKVTRSAITLDPVTHHAVQTITIKNISTDALPLPMTLQFSSLTSTRNSITTTTSIVGRTGLLGTTPLLKFAVPAGMTQLAPGQSVSVKITFGATLTTRISYLLNVLFM